MSVWRHPLFLAEISSEAAVAPVDARLVDRLQESFARVSGPEARLAERFYCRLFAAHPELRSLFPANMVRQQEKLIATLRSVVDRLSGPKENLADLAALGRHHAGLGVKASHYRLVVQLLVATMADACPVGWSAELAADWTQTLTLMSDAMIAGAERSMAQS